MNQTRRKSSAPAMLVNRLLGMETEYATLVANQPGKSSATLPASAIVYAKICEAIRRDQPTVPGLFDADQMFLASGGAVTFESHPSLHKLPGGLVEIATPEVASPNELLACQRSIDQLVSEAASNCLDEVDLRVLKNSSDALGHIYGCQENYDAVVATGFWLLIYRVCIGILWILQVISLLLSLPILALAFSVLLLFKVRQSHFEGAGVIGDQSTGGANQQSASELFDRLPKWIRVMLMSMLRVVHFPTVLLLRLVAKHVAFRQQRKYLTALLVSRVSLCGTGDLDHDGCYRLSAKAMAIDVVSDMGSYSGERPIFVFGHWLGQFCSKTFLSLGSTKAMFAKRQRLQIGLSDSNLSELAEYVKVGSVSLVLDMIENGATKRFVTLSNPIAALHTIASDWNLVRRVKTSRGKQSALEIQRRYWHAARDFVRSTPAEQRGEAEIVIERWGELLEVVRSFRRDAKNVIPALGRVDWLSKRWMMDQLGPHAQWMARKKTDLRYHELSPQGYYYKLSETNPSLSIVDREQVAKRRRTPPADSPATKRGWLIREFSDSEAQIAAEWGYAVMGEGKERRRIDFCN